MLKNYFALDGKPTEISKQSDFIKTILASDEVENIIYLPDILEPDKNHPKIKIDRKLFRNVSFSKTHLKNIEFTSCHFEDCLFIGAKIVSCKFRQCTFKGVNTHEIEIKKTYLNPRSFEDNFDEKDIEKSNIAVHLFQQLLNNSRDEEQSDFARISNFYFKTWQGRLSRSKYHHKKPYPITKFEFYKEFFPNVLYKFFFGYGLRLRNFAKTFGIVFSFFYFLNLLFWKDYKMCYKDFPIQSFNSEIFDFKANFFYTADVMTQLVDSQFQPSSDCGMTMLTIQGITGFILFSFLITVLINRFVK